MADQRDVAAGRMRPGLEAADPDAIDDVVVAHAVAAADEQPGLAHAPADALAQRRLAIIGQHQRRVDRHRPHTGIDRIVERGLDAAVVDGEDDVLDRLRQRRQRRVAAHALDLLVARIDGVQRALVAAVQQVQHRLVTDAAAAHRGADDGDRARPQQRIEPMWRPPAHG